jgi:hypothetical protein
MKFPRFVFRPSPSLVFTISACLTLFTTQVATAGAATLTINPPSLWAGHISVGQSATLSATLTNSGPETVTVSQAVASNSGYRVTSPSFPLTLGTGQSAEVTIQFAPLSFHHTGGTITFISDADNPALNLLLNHWGMPANISANPSAVNFGSVTAGGSGTALESLTNDTTAPLTISSVNVQPSAFSSTGLTTPVTLTPGGSLTFEILFTPTTSGPLTGELTVVSNATNLLTIPLSGNAAAAGTLAVSPASANLGSVTVGSSKTTSATLSALGSSVVVSSANTTSPEFTVSGMSLPLTIAAGQTVPIAVIFSPNSSGATMGTLSFVSNAGNSPTVESLSGTGAPLSQHDVALSWTASSSGVAGYNVYRSTTSGGPYSRLNGSPGGTTSFSDASVQSGQTYYYVVTGVTSQGAESSYSNQVPAAVP